MPPTDSRPVSELFADALNQFSKLVRNEIQLARAEISLKASQLLTAMGLLVASAIFVIPSLVLLLMALAAWLVEVGMTPSIAHLVAGVAGLLITAVLGGIGLSRLRAGSLVPTRTLDQLQQDAAAAREHV